MVEVDLYFEILSWEVFYLRADLPTGEVKLRVKYSAGCPHVGLCVLLQDMIGALGRYCVD